MSPGNEFFSIADDSEIPLCDVADLPALLNKSKPVHTAPPKGSKEHRTVQRYIVKWRCTASIDSQQLHHGHIKDISVSGAAILHEQNFHAAEFIKLHIYMSPPPPARLPCIISVLCKVAYTLFDSKEQRYRTGVSFLKFATEYDPSFLDEHLKKHSLTVLF
ncbi:MAG: PilZ domain-containing protein [Gallionella sp.]|jgi:hypothetical protein|nr:PilZ domain-containing protein [Gallionella sp.]MCK9352997.1 PilZ domain-containing protein [Gallionella sp.]